MAYNPASYDSSGDALKIKPLLEDLSNLNIGDYLVTNRFLRLTVKLKIEISWDNAYQRIKEGKRVFIMGHDSKPGDSDDALGLLLTHIFLEKKSFFYLILNNILIDFSEHSKNKVNFSEIIKDLQLINAPEKILEKLSEISFSKTTTKEAPLSSDLKILKNKTEVEEKSISFIEQKTQWKKRIAKAETEKVLDELVDYALNGSEYENQIINLSSRWHSLNNGIHENSMKQDDIDIERSKINNATMAIIDKLNSTN